MKTLAVLVDKDHTVLDIRLTPSTKTVGDLLELVRLNLTLADIHQHSQQQQQHHNHHNQQQQHQRPPGVTNTGASTSASASASSSSASSSLHVASPKAASSKSSAAVSPLQTRSLPIARVVTASNRRRPSRALHDDSDDDELDHEREVEDDDDDDDDDDDGDLTTSRASRAAKRRSREPTIDDEQHERLDDDDDDDDEGASSTSLRPRSGRDRRRRRLDDDDDEGSSRHRRRSRVRHDADGDEEHTSGSVVLRHREHEPDRDDDDDDDARAPSSRRRRQRRHHDDDDDGDAEHDLRSRRRGSAAASGGRDSDDSDSAESARSRRRRELVSSDPEQPRQQITRSSSLRRHHSDKLAYVLQQPAATSSGGSGGSGGSSKEADPDVEIKPHHDREPEAEAEAEAEAEPSGTGSRSKRTRTRSATSGSSLAQQQRTGSSSTLLSSAPTPTATAAAAAGSVAMTPAIAAAATNSNAIASVIDVNGLYVRAPNLKYDLFLEDHVNLPVLTREERFVYKLRPQRIHVALAHDFYIDTSLPPNELLAIIANRFGLSPLANHYLAMSPISTSHTTASSPAMAATSPSTSSLASPRGSSNPYVAFGVARGRCNAAACDCHQYQPGSCSNCGHYPASHAALGAPSSSTGSGALASAPAGGADLVPPLLTHRRQPSASSASAMSTAAQLATIAPSTPHAPPRQEKRLIDGEPLRTQPTVLFGAAPPTLHAATGNSAPTVTSPWAAHELHIVHEGTPLGAESLLLLDRDYVLGSTNGSGSSSSSKPAAALSAPILSAPPTTPTRNATPMPGGSASPLAVPSILTITAQHHRRNSTHDLTRSKPRKDSESPSKKSSRKRSDVSLQVAQLQQQLQQQQQQQLTLQQQQMLQQAGSGFPDDSELSSSPSRDMAGRPRTAGLKRALSRVFQGQQLVREAGAGSIPNSSSNYNLQQHATSGAAASAGGGDASGKLFGSSLQKSWEEGASTLIDTLLLRLDRAVQVEGLFRKSGNQERINNIRKLADRGEPINDALAAMDDHDVACTLKYYLQLLPEPLLTVKFYDRFQAAAREADLDVQMYYLRSLVSSLPRQHYELLKDLLALLVRVADKSDLNKMSESNLAIVFGPLFTWNNDVDLATNKDVVLQQARDNAQVVEAILKNANLLFSTEEEEPLRLIPLAITHASPSDIVAELELEIGDVLYLFRYDPLEQYYYAEFDGRITLFEEAKIDTLLSFANIQIPKALKRT